MLLKKALLVQVVMLMLGGPEMLIFSKFILILYRLQISQLVRSATAERVSESFFYYKTSFYSRHNTFPKQLEEIIVENLERQMFENNGV